MQILNSGSTTIAFYINNVHYEFSPGETIVIPDNQRIPALEQVELYEDLIVIENSTDVLTASFTVDSTTDSGIKDLVGGAGIKNIYMPSSGDTPYFNQAGILIVQMEDNYSRFISVNAQAQPKNDGSTIAVNDEDNWNSGELYVIKTLGDLTAEQWHTLGVPAGITPAVGVSFLARSDVFVGATTSEVTDIYAQTSKIAYLEILGDPNLSVNPNRDLQDYGAEVICQFRPKTGDETAESHIPDGTVIHLQLSFIKLTT